eukprot:s411_g2.t1
MVEGITTLPDLQELGGSRNSRSAKKRYDLQCKDRFLASEATLQSHRPATRPMLKWSGDYSLPRLRAKLATTGAGTEQTEPDYAEVYRPDLGQSTILRKDLACSTLGTCSAPLTRSGRCTGLLESLYTGSAWSSSDAACHNLQFLSSEAYPTPPVELKLRPRPTLYLRHESPEFFAAVAETGGFEAFARSSGCRVLRKGASRSFVKTGSLAGRTRVRKLSLDMTLQPSLSTNKARPTKSRFH